VLWIEACARARETEAARVELDALGSGEQSLPEKARRYHAAVRRQRDAAERRISAQLAVPPDAGEARWRSRRPISRRPADR
jgi:hypothetical protein